jgi:hypothetical protein
MKTKLEQARQALADADTEQAIDLLQEIAENQAYQIEHRDQYRDQVTLLSSQFAQYQRKTSIGTLAGTEASVESARLNESILFLINAIQAGRALDHTSPVNRSKKTRWLYIGITCLLLVGGIWYFFRGKVVQCPDYQTAATWKIAVLPFVNLGDRAAKPEEVLITSINAITKKNQLSAIAKTWQTKEEALKALKPNALEHCGVDLLVTGQYVVLKSDSIEVSLTYVFSDARPPIQTGFESFKNIAALSQSSMQNRSLSDAVLSICTLLAMRENRSELASKWLGKIEKPSDWEMELKSRPQFIEPKQPDTLARPIRELPIKPIRSKKLNRAD